LYIIAASESVTEPGINGSTFMKKNVFVLSVSVQLAH